MNKTGALNHSNRRKHLYCMILTKKPSEKPFQIDRLPVYQWDFALRLTTFLVNGNSSGPGSGGVIVQDGVYDNIKTAPTTGYAYDTTSSQRAIKDGSWYDYNPTTRSFVPKAGKVFIFRNADGVHYTKMELLSTNYVPFTGMFPQQIIYKMRFTYQPDGSKNF